MARTTFLRRSDRIIVGLIILMLALVCQGQQPAGSAPVTGDVRSISELPGFDAILYHGSTQIRFVAPHADSSPKARAASVLAAFARVTDSTDVVEIGTGKFDFGNQPPVMLPKCKTKGQGKANTLWFSQKQIDVYHADATHVVAGGPAWCFQDGSIVEEISFTDDCFNPGEDGGCIGFLSDTTNAHAVIRRCACQCRDWTVYNWSPNNRLVIEDCDLTTGRVAIAAEDSGDGQEIDVVRSRIYGDASLSKSIGATSNKLTGGVFAAVCRGGRMSLVDCEVNLRGKASASPSFTPRVAAVTDKGGGNSAPAGNTRIVVYNLRSSIDPNGADPAQCLDLDLRYEFVRKQIRCNFANCWGSAADGGLKKNF